MIKTLFTDRLILREYQETDKEAYFKLKSDKATMYYLQDIQLSNQEEADAELSNLLSDMRDEHRKFYFLHIELKDTHEQVGSIGYTVVDETPLGKIVHLGYFTYPKFWNNGYVTEALKKVLEYAFTENNVYRITTGCLAENSGSERVMIKCGFTKEAEHIDWEWHDGKMKTRLEYRLLNKEWKKTTDKQKAKQLLSYHSGRNADINNEKWQNGFLGSLRPFKGQLIEENFKEVMECIKTLKDELMQNTLGRDIVSDIVGIVYLSRIWSSPHGMLGSNHLLTQAQTNRLNLWTDIIEGCLMWLLEGDEKDAFWDYKLYLDGEFEEEITISEIKREK